MLNEKEFQTKAAVLGSNLKLLWQFVYQAVTLGITPDLMDAIRRAMSEVNRLHREMFPDFEHALYGDDLLELVEDDESGG